MPPLTLTILLGAVLFAGALLYFGFTIKHKARWLLLLAGGISLAAIFMIFATTP